MRCADRQTHAMTIQPVTQENEALFTRRTVLRRGVIKSFLKPIVSGATSIFSIPLIIHDEIMRLGQGFRPTGWGLRTPAAADQIIRLRSLVDKTKTKSRCAKFASVPINFTRNDVVCDECRKYQ